MNGLNQKIEQLGRYIPRINWVLQEGFYTDNDSAVVLLRALRAELMECFPHQQRVILASMSESFDWSGSALIHVKSEPHGAH